MSIYSMSKDSLFLSHWLHCLALSHFYYQILIGHIDEIQCDVSAHSYAMY